MNQLTLLQWDQAQVDALLHNYGATHFILQRDGKLLAVCGTVNVPVTGQNIGFGPSDYDIAQAAIAKAQAQPAA